MLAFVDWAVFLGAGAGCLILDNLLLKTKKLTHQHALKLVAFWVVVGLGFSTFVFASRGKDAGIAYISGYLLEFMLSLDNLFFFQAIFKLYRTPHDQRDKALFFGIAFAAFLRLIFFLIGTELFAWTKAARYVFGAIILYSAYVVAFEASEENQPHAVSTAASEADAAASDNPVMKVLERFVPFLSHYGPAGEFVISDSRGKKKATMLLMVVLFLGLVDVIIAVDAVAAKISEYNDIYVNFSSSFFAMLCLRALYFVIEYLADMFCLLKYGLALILCYVGVRLMVETFVVIPEIVSMIVIVTCFLGSIAASHLQNSYFPVRTRSNSVELQNLPHFTDASSAKAPDSPLSTLQIACYTCVLTAKTHQLIRLLLLLLVHKRIIDARDACLGRNRDDTRAPDHQQADFARLVRQDVGIFRTAHILDAAVHNDIVDLVERFQNTHQLPAAVAFHADFLLHEFLHVNDGRLVTAHYVSIKNARISD